MTAVTMNIPTRYSSSSGEDGEITMAAGVTMTPRVNNTRSPLSDTDIEYEEIDDTDSGMAFQEEDDIAEYWDPYCKYSHAHWLTCFLTRVQPSIAYE